MAGQNLIDGRFLQKIFQYQEQLQRHILGNPDFIRPESRRNEVLGFLQTQKLGDLSISRPKSRLSWGIELPFDKDYVTYVWFDALVNYISALEYLSRRNRPSIRFWPANVHLVGKDILTTHAVYWSTMLMALELPLPKTIFAHGWWTVDGEKMSKSRGNVVDPNKMVDEFGADAFRYFLLREVPFGQDGDFSQTGMVTRINSELADGLGNLLSRSLTMIERFAGGVVPAPVPSANGELEIQLAQTTAELEADADDHIEHFRFSRALECIGEVVQGCDQYIDKTLRRGYWQRNLRIGHDWRMHSNCIAMRLSSLVQFIYPVMPATAEEMAQQLGLRPKREGVLFKWNEMTPQTQIEKGPHCSRASNPNHKEPNQ